MTNSINADGRAVDCARRPRNVTFAGTALAMALWISLLAHSPSALAGTTCQMTANGELCTSEVDFATFAQQAFQTQQASQWCWAASIAMIFSYYGHPVSQERIVTEVYGSAVNMPAQAGVQMAQQLNREWVDDDGMHFSSHLTGAYDAGAGVYNLTNAKIVSELDAERPLLYGNYHHAMVLTAVQYYKTIDGPYIVAAGVFDPWPGSGAHPLTQAELVAAHVGGEMMFLATATIDEVVVTPPGESGGGGAIDGFMVLALAVLLALQHARHRRGAARYGPVFRLR